MRQGTSSTVVAEMRLSLVRLDKFLYQLLRVYDSQSKLAIDYYIVPRPLDLEFEIQVRQELEKWLPSIMKS